jgi:hypothetical protein
LAGVLWCLGLNDELILLLESSQEVVSFSLDLVRVAAYFRSNQKVGEGNLLLQKIKDRYQRVLTPKQQGQLRIGLAYLYFHLILCLDLEHRDSKPEAVADYFKKAISFASEALALIDEPATRLYAQNCYLYYMAEFGDTTMLPDMMFAAEELKKWMDRRGMWQYRFDDTLARYYFYRAQLADREATWKFAIDQAVEFIERAWRFALGDEEILRFRSRLGDALLEGFRAPGN